MAGEKGDLDIVVDSFASATGLVSIDYAWHGGERDVGE
jgi:hypothetical protein